RVELLERELSRLADAHEEALVKSAERSARLETAVRRRLERECALLRQEECSTERPAAQRCRVSSSAAASSASAATQETLQRLEAENLAVLGSVL
uniref:HMMR_C domain-containing protein n=1 Tax=Macrostomum lignano TaxID=282301 RepID=A0A1I8FG49_9PLAT